MLAAMSNMKPRFVETLADGSWLAELRPSGNAGRKATPLTIRVIDYRIDDGRGNDETSRLFTTILDPDDVSALDLAPVYTERWEIESAFDELKTHQRGPRTVLRSKSPDLVLQEVWGHLCCHYAIRTLMWEAADHVGSTTVEDRVSFVAALRIARRSIAVARIEAWFRMRALIEEKLKDGKLGLALRHLPSGYEAVNAMWMWAVLVGLNISPWLQALTGHDRPTGRAYAKRFAESSFASLPG